MGALARHFFVEIIEANQSTCQRRRQDIPMASPDQYFTRDIIDRTKAAILEMQRQEHIPAAKPAPAQPKAKILDGGCKLYDLNRRQCSTAKSLL